ncbi:Transcriptional regulatory protein moc3-like protein 3 [Colletotrichum chlorophyti]|uniref:Transcriptional regulatory protein moc3-like protein 3 n=1 Tax=Colletotrichum chlorophyti TaxID=708187 RepID=A0A1Q8RSN9_9PEZI|nr:Transcriptional regulatory protein moc3-like protein 3 [Colletotrichum chlorophyti]
MARKGSRKTRTGCVTCKIRKVKCDEAKPRCNRCTATGRQCDGYDPVTIVSTKPTGLRHYRPQHVFPGTKSSREGRALQYFYEAAAPFLGGAVDPNFWTKLVMQFASFEPAARHSVVAISTLAEQHQLLQGQVSAAQNSGSNEWLFALRHYNAAIRNITEMTSQDRQPVALLVCVLFVCLEFLQANKNVIIKHCKHGFSLLQNTVNDYAWTKEHLLPLFRRLSIFVYVWADDIEDFPDMDGLESRAPDSFQTFAGAQLMIEELLSRTLRLVRRGDSYRTHPKITSKVPSQLLVEQDEIHHALDRWRSLFEDFKNRLRSPAEDAVPDPGKEESAGKMQRILQARYESCRTWANTAFDNEESRADASQESIENSRSLQAETSCQQPPEFNIDSGHMPSISLTAVRCLHLESRLRDLNLVPVPGLPRENICMEGQAGACPLIMSQSSTTERKKSH